MSCYRQRRRATTSSSSSSSSDTCTIPLRHARSAKAQQHAKRAHARTTPSTKTAPVSYTKMERQTQDVLRMPHHICEYTEYGEVFYGVKRQPYGARRHAPHMEIYANAWEYLKPNEVRGKMRFFAGCTANNFILPTSYLLRGARAPATALICTATSSGASGGAGTTGAGTTTGARALWGAVTSLQYPAVRANLRVYVNRTGSDSERMCGSVRGC